MAVLIASACAPTAPDADDRAEADASEGSPPVIGPIFAGPMRADSVFDAATLVRAMRDRHGAGWYRTLSLTRDTYVLLRDGTVREDSGRQWVALPGRLRIEMGDPLAGTDFLFVRGNAFVYDDGELAATLPEHNPFLVWSFDVYAQSPTATLAALQDMDYDLGAFRADVWDGREMYVLGTPAAGEAWVDRQTLLFTRLVESDLGGAVEDTRFLDYEPLGGGWIAPRVEVWRGDERVSWYFYRDIEVGLNLDPVLFDPRRWAEGAAASR